MVTTIPDGSSVQSPAIGLAADEVLTKPFVGSNFVVAFVVGFVVDLVLDELVVRVVRDVTLVSDDNDVGFFCDAQAGKKTRATIPIIKHIIVFFIERPSMVKQVGFRNTAMSNIDLYIKICSSQQ